jgi:hypothetical protein
MKKRAASLILALVLAFGIAAPAAASTYEADYAADYLYCVGLFKGTGADENVGDPYFDLDTALTRQQALVMLIRLLGKEAAATGTNWWHPFTDVDAWASNYVGYAYQMGITNGISATRFGGGSTSSTAAQYVTFVLRALGYVEGYYGDFIWSDPWELSDSIGLTSNYTKNISYFTRGYAAEISYSALDITRNSSYFTLRQSLEAQGVIPDLSIIKISADTIYLPVGETWEVWVFQSDEYSNVVLKAEYGNSTVLHYEWKNDWYNQCKAGLYVTGLKTGTSTLTVTYDQGGSSGASDTVTVIVY